jgi:hypothetical protein
MKLISQAVKKFFDLNEVPDGLWSQVSDEAYFSKSECEVCKTNLHGNRFDVEFVAHSLAEGKFTVPVCGDCLMYMANGEDAPIWINYHGSLGSYAKALDNLTDKIAPPSWLRKKE